MLKRTAIAVLLTIAALASIDWASSSFVERPCFIESIVESSGTQHPNEEKPQYTCAYQGGLIIDGIYFIADWKPEIWTAFGTLVIAAFTTILGVFTVRLARSTRMAANAARDNALYIRNAQRPYITPINVNLRGWTEWVTSTEETANLAIHFDLRNYGSGIGFVIDWAITHEIAAGDAPAGNEPLLHPANPARIPLSPETSRGWEAPFHTVQMDARQRMTLLKYEQSLFFYGYIRYLDFFGIIRRNGFLFGFVPDATTPENSGFAIADGDGPFWYDVEEPANQ